MDKILASGINKDALKQALAFKMKSPFLESSHLLVADFSINSRDERLYYINLETGEVEKIHISHGNGRLPPGPSAKRPHLRGEGVNWGDRDHDGMIDTCKVPSYITKTWPEKFKEMFEREIMTRPGFYATKPARRYYNQKNWRVFGPDQVNAIPMQGLTEGVNEDAEEESVAFNAPLYNAIPGMGGKLPMGRGSYGPAIKPSDRGLLGKIPPNTVYYSYVPKCDEDMEVVYDQVAGWENMCETSTEVVDGRDCPEIGNSVREAGKDVGIEGPYVGPSDGSVEER